MPNYTQYPTAADVSVRFKSAAFWPPDSDPNKQAWAYEQAAVAVQGAIAEWEHRTGWEPFLQASASSDTILDYEGEREVSLGAGYLAVPTIQLNGTTLDSTRYQLRRYNPLTTKPFASMEFYGGGFPGNYGGYGYGSSYNRIRQLTVSGTKGVFTTVPPDVWEQILQRAALNTLTSIENLQSIASISMDGFSKAFDIVGILTQKDLVNQWGRDFTKYVDQYKWVI